MSRPTCRRAGSLSTRACYGRRITTLRGVADPILIGVLYDFPQHDGGAGFEEALHLGLAEGRDKLDRDIELLSLQVAGLPGGTEKAVRDGFRELDEQGVLLIVGPSISDNGVIARDLADEAELPAINYTGGEITRSKWMFHYQVGSLAEEPVVLAQTLAQRGLTSTAVAYDDSIVGRTYVEAFAVAAADNAVEVLGTTAVASSANDLSAVVKRMKDTNPASVCYLGVGMAARPLAVAIKEQAWDVPVIANSALMFGYIKKDWRADWEGWTYIDTIADDNPVRAALKERSPRTAAGSVGVAAYDIGRLVVDGIARGGHLTRAGVRHGLEQVKRLPATSGYAGTTMGFGNYDHAALKGGYLVLREWRGGRSVQI
jgi:branched-chain amino acid transport system substrate-binding protein